MKVHKIPLILFFSMLINLLPQLAFADNYNLSFSYSPSDMQIEFSAGELPSGGTPVAVTVYPEQEKRLGADLINDCRSVSRIFYSKENQELKITLPLPREMPGGTYAVRISCEFFEELRVFNHINSTLSKQALEKLNSAANAAEFAEILRQNMTALGIDENILGQYSPQLENDLFSQREIYFKDGYDTEGFNITLNSLAAQYRIKAAGADIDALLRRYADMLKISYADYSALDAECKNYFEDCIRKLDSAKEPLYRFYELCIVKAKLAAAKRYQEFRAITEENAGILEITVTVSENAAEVFKLFYERRDEILSDISKAAQIFEECEKAVQNKSIKTFYDRRWILQNSN